jgi:hypothetical protein
MAVLSPERFSGRIAPSVQYLNCSPALGRTAIQLLAKEYINETANLGSKLLAASNLLAVGESR